MFLLQCAWANRMSTTIAFERARAHWLVIIGLGTSGWCLFVCYSRILCTICAHARARERYCVCCYKIQYIVCICRYFVQRRRRRRQRRSRAEKHMPCPKTGKEWTSPPESCQVSKTCKHTQNVPEVSVFRSYCSKRPYSKHISLFKKCIKRNWDNERQITWALNYVYILYKVVRTSFVVCTRIQNIAMYCAMQLLRFYFQVVGSVGSGAVGIYYCSPVFGVLNLSPRLLCVCVCLAASRLTHAVIIAIHFVCSLGVHENS